MSGLLPQTESGFKDICSGIQGGAETIRSERENMQTAADVFSALNALVLDLGPVVALAALAVSWYFRNRRYRQEEQELRGRIGEYAEEWAGENAGDASEPGK